MPRQLDRWVSAAFPVSRRTTRLVTPVAAARFVDSFVAGDADRRQHMYV